jgi:imidazolonepropionase
MATVLSEARITENGGALAVQFSDGRKSLLSLKTLRDGTELLGAAGALAAEDAQGAVGEGKASAASAPNAPLCLQAAEVAKNGQRLTLRFSDGRSEMLAADRVADLAGFVGAAERPADLLVHSAVWLLTAEPTLAPGRSAAPDSAGQTPKAHSLQGFRSKTAAPPKATRDRRVDAEAALGIVNGGALAVRAGRVVGVGATEEVEKMAQVGPDTVRLDATGLGVCPGFVDPHTHPVFGGQRAREFALRAAGATYQEIAEAGGGIRSTMAATRKATDAELRASTRRRLHNLLCWGTTTIEGKSGYALELEGELRMLRIMRDLEDLQPIDIARTLLAAHVIPPEFMENRQGYVDLVCTQIIPTAAAQQLATSCDAFCEQGAFTPEETRRILETAQKHGLSVRLHAEQFTDSGGAALAAELGALSADHLEAINDTAIEAMAASGTVAVLLPGAALMVGDVFPDGRRLIDGGVAVALGTDLNPGTSMTESLPLMMSLACTRCGLTPAEAWLGVTVNSARAVGRSDVGRLSVGAKADFLLLDAPEYASVPYHLSHNYVCAVYKAGRLALRRGLLSADR